MKIRPLNDRILVKRLEGEAKTAGGIIIPDSAKEKPAEGEIVAVGPGKLNDAGERVAIDVGGRRPRTFFKIRRHRGEVGWRGFSYYARG